MREADVVYPDSIYKALDTYRLKISRRGWPKQNIHMMVKPSMKLF